MNIIGQTKDGFILAATRDEVANIQGACSAFSIEREAVNDAARKLEVGRSFHIAKLYESAVATLAAYKELRDEFKKIQGNIGRLVGFMGDAEK